MLYVWEMASSSSARLFSDHRSLAAVNFFLASVGLTQVTRIFLYQRSLSNGTISQVAESDVKDIAETTEGILKDSKKSLDGLVK